MLWLSDEAVLPQSRALAAKSPDFSRSHVGTCAAAAFTVMSSGVPEPPLQLGTQLLESVVTLVRAEAKLLWSHVRIAGTRSVMAAGFTLFALILTPIAFLILALSPVLGAWAPVELVIASAAPVTVLAVLAWILAIRGWRKAFQNPLQPRQSRRSAAANVTDRVESARS